MKSISTRRFGKNLSVFVALAMATILFGVGPSSHLSNAVATGQITGQTAQTEPGISKTTAELQAAATKGRRPFISIKRELEIPGHERRPQDPKAIAAARFPAESTSASSFPETSSPTPLFPQTVGVNFNAVTGPNETDSFPPDTMGAVGPSQFIVFLNGRLRSFNKVTGVADGVLNLNPDDFFNSVMTPSKNAGFNFTTDPQIRYDRLTQRWILCMIDVPSTSDTSIGDLPNRVMVAVSDAASAGVISANTVWTFYPIQQDMVGGADTGEFLDYDSLGVDNNALYIGGNMFDAASASFVNTSVFVIQKASILNGGPPIVTAFRDLIDNTDGPESPRGVDNFNASANEGYFVGTSTNVFGRLILRRVANPGSAAPTISPNIPIAVNTTSFPIAVAHLGNSGGTNGKLDALDDRLYAAHIRNGKLWTAHTVAVSAAGLATNSSPDRRDAVRWYELNVPPNAGNPTIVQSGTVFDGTASVNSARQFWVPSVMVSGQGHAAFGYSAAGAAYRIEAYTNGRLVGDSLGTSGVPTLLATANASYNPTGEDISGGGPRRWGDYSFTCVDPDDDMTMWTVQEYCNGTNTYGVRVAKLIAPPPATPATASPKPGTGVAATNVVITGLSVSGSGFFDPGTGFAKRLSASVSGGVVVNSVTYTDPTHITLNVSTVGVVSGSYNVTVTNPDGQSKTANGIFAVGSANPSPSPTVSPTPSATPLPSATPTATPGGIPAPLISPVSGTYKKQVSVTISRGTASGAKIYYTINGSDPTTSSPLYGGQTITIKGVGTVTVKAINVVGGVSSAITTRTYTIK